MYALKSDTDNILLANYNSLKYSRNMLSALEQDSSKAIDFLNVIWLNKRLILPRLVNRKQLQI